MSRPLFQIFNLFLFLSVSLFASGPYYQHRLYEGPFSVHILQVDPTESAILPAIAQDHYPSLEKVSSLAKRHQALAAVNGGFFRMTEPDPGLSSGLFKINGILLAPPRFNRGAIGWTDSVYPLIDRVALENNELLPLNVPENKALWNAFEHIVSGTPVLIAHGKEITDLTPERLPGRFVQDKHPRTAIGLLPNHHWLFVVVDGRNPIYGMGMTLKELSTFMMDLGCEHALNLDGGGSSALYFKGRIVSTPSGFDDDSPEATLGQERPVANAILIF